MNRDQINRAAIHLFIDHIAAEAKQEGRHLVEQAKEQTERDFAFFRRSTAQKFRWIRYNGGKK